MAEGATNMSVEDNVQKDTWVIKVGAFKFEVKLDLGGRIEAAKSSEASKI